MSEERHAGGRNTFLGLAAVILGGLLFAAGVMVGRQMGVNDGDRHKDHLDRIDQRDEEKPSADGGDLTFHKELSKAPPTAKQAPKPAPAPAKPEPPKADPKESSDKAKPARASAGFSLQVASYRDKSQAEQLKKKLNGKGYGRARVIQGEVPGKGTYFRVRLGPFAGREEAHKAQEKLLAGEGLRALVVLEE